MGASGLDHTGTRGPGHTRPGWLRVQRSDWRTSGVTGGSWCVGSDVDVNRRTSGVATHGALWLCLVIVMLSWYRSWQERLAQPWIDAAEHLELTWHQTFGLTWRRNRVYGRIRGHDVACAARRTSSGESTSTKRYCWVGYRDGDLGYDLLIRTQSRPRVRRSNAATGDPGFDGRFLVRTSQPDRVALVLDDQVRDKINYLASRGVAKITGDAILWEIFGAGAPRSANEITDIVTAMVEVAEAFERQRI